MADPQTEVYTIFCVVLGENTEFSVDIPSNKTVDHLKKKIKAEKPNGFADVDADELDLYHFEISDNEDRATVVEQKLLEDPAKLSPRDKLADVFGDGDGPKRTDFIIIRPPRTDSPIVEEKPAVANERENLKKLLKFAPSSLAKPSDFQPAAEDVVYCNRPFNYDTIPIDLFQPEFGEFKKDCTIPPTPWAQGLLQRLTESACKWHIKELFRRSEIHEVLKVAGLYLAAETISGTEYKTDGNWRVNIMPPVIRECKNEFGCALLEAIGYYVQFLQFPLDSYRDTRFPCILMVDVGPCIAFYGCLWTGEQLHVEPLTPNYDLTTHWTDEKARNAIASSLDAFKNTIARLERHYNALAPASSVAPSVDRTFPYPTSYQDEKGQQIKFTYQSRINQKLVFRASVDGRVENNDLCVKFTKRYSKETHQFLANLGHAPRLRGVLSLPADWFMVIMDFSQYAQLSELTLPSNESRSLVRSRIRNIVQKLHDHGFVHGDIRTVNILVDPKTLTSEDDCAVHLIDFDWAGKDQEVRYPGRVNNISIKRPDGASDGELITKSHDMEMVTLLI